MDISPFIVRSDSDVRLKDYDPCFTGKFKDKTEARDKLIKDIDRLARLQDILYAQDRYALLLIFQAMDAAGKDSTIKHVMSGINPQGCQVFSFKKPSVEELDHDYLWRCSKSLPERGRIGIFNRSYYEEVLVTRVHPEILDVQQLPPKSIDKHIYKRRFDEINNFERYLVGNGIIILKFFLHISKSEQKRRFIERIDNPDKNWKFSKADAAERAHWKEYMHAYEDVFSQTSTGHAPWHIIPADNKWFTRVAVANIIVKRLESLELVYPEVTEEHKLELQEMRSALMDEENAG
jgi:PPK2 family polyphosphate:nucleotide phosphotransferase